MSGRRAIAAHRKGPERISIGAIIVKKCRILKVKQYPHKPVYAWMHSTISIVCYLYWAQKELSMAGRSNPSRMEHT